MPYLQTNGQESLPLASGSQVPSILNNFLIPEFQFLDMIPDLLQSLVDRVNISYSDHRLFMILP